jgi:hypothetical protein
LRLDRALTNQKELLVKTIEAHMRGDIE